MGIIHRDVKPGNITVESYDPPRAKIIDFGCAVAQDGVLNDGVGTIRYLAPGQHKGKYHGHSVDEWSCGLVGLELLGYSKLSDRQVGEEALVGIHEWLKGPSGDSKRPIGICCRTMLLSDSNDRMTAKDALSGPLKSFSYIREKDQEKPTPAPFELEVKRRCL